MKKLTWSLPKGLLLAVVLLTVALAAIAQTAVEKTGAAKKTETIPWNQIGARAGADYKGDGLSVTPDDKGARLHCAFQRLDGEATPGGLWLSSIVPDQVNDRFQVKATAVGREQGSSGDKTSIHLLQSHGDVCVTGKTVRFTRANLVEEYAVSVDGVKQDFIVTEKPSGDGALRVQLAVAGARVEPIANGVELVLENSHRKIAYSRLHATDATGKELPARIVAATELTVVVNDAGAKYPVRIDPTFSDANWISMAADANVVGRNSAVNAMAVDEAGNLYVGGTFFAIGSVLATNVAEWNGSSWSALGGGVGNINSTVYALGVSGGVVYAGGNFGTAGGNAIANIARWDGTNWSALGSGVDADVQALTISGNTLYAGGYFAAAGGNPINNIAQWNGTNWSGLGSGVTGPVYAIAVSGNTLFAGGLFNGVVQFNGTNWSALGSAMDISGVRALAVSGSTLYAGGQFTMAGGNPANNIAEWDGTNWSALGSGMDETVFSLALSGNKLYAAGNFTNAGGVAASYVAQWDGNSWSPLASGFNNPAAVLLVRGNTLYAGLYATFDSGYPNFISQWNGSNWSPVGRPSGPSGFVNSLVVVGNKLYAGGNFVTAGSNVVNNIAQWDGNTWSALGTGVDANVVVVGATSGGMVYATGQFGLAEGILTNGFAQWDGTNWSGIDGNPYVFAAIGNTLYASGEFPTTSGTAYIAQREGTNWSPVGSVSNLVGPLAVSGGMLYAAGNFTIGDENVTNCVAQWNGTNWSLLGSELNGNIFALAASDGKVYAAIGGAYPPTNVVEWNGTNWSALGPGLGLGPSDWLFALAASGNMLYAGGLFTNAAGIPANNIIQWDGTNWSAMGSGIDGQVDTLAVWGNALLVGGDFITAGKTVSPFLAMAVPVPPPEFTKVSSDASRNLTLSIATSNNVSSRLYMATNLTAPLWQPVYTNLNGGAWQFTDSNTMAFPAKLYRLSTP